ncbi:stress response protein NST1 [Diachasma alloeum]|uniref:stress response protein NST1 n=1 Tax=Diachasma alloeum TaxID=454923 RepID=UPI0007381FE9|nr:stress response protein NST1 [Diachasma alloeum]
MIEISGDVVLGNRGRKEEASAIDGSTTVASLVVMRQLFSALQSVITEYYWRPLASAFSSRSPIVVFDPTLESHQKYAKHLSSPDQHSSDSKNLLVSNPLHPPLQIQRKSEAIKPTPPDRLEEYEPLKIPVLEKEQVNFQEDKGLPRKLGPDKLRNPPPAMNSNNFVSKRHLNIPAPPRDPQNYRELNSDVNPVVLSPEKHQYYTNYLRLNPSGNRVEKNPENAQVHEQIYENGYEEISPVVNPEVQRVNSVRRNRINIGNANILDRNSGEEVGATNYEVRGKKKKSKKSHRVNKPEVRPEYEYGDHREQRNPNERDRSQDVALETIKKQELSPAVFRADAYDKVRRQDEGGGEDRQVEVVAGSQKEEKRQPKVHSEKHEEGGGEEGHEDHHEAGGEEEKKGYDSHHEHEKGEKGHHDKEDHDKHYDEEEGKENKHSDDSSYYKHYDSGEKKEKESAFDEEGKFNKGHSTKGNHVVHKKDEYEKLEEFYDESHDEDEHEKDEGYHHKYEKEHGGSEKSGHYDAGEEVEKHGKKSKHEKGHHYKDKKGHDQRAGDDKHHEKESKYGKKGGYEDGKKWEYKKGH